MSSGAPFASGFIATVDSVQVTGTPATYVLTAASGARTIRSFCGVCGTPLFARGEAYPVMSIRFSTLDDSTGFKPGLDIWTSSAQPWTCLDGAIPHFDTSPPGAS